MRGKIRKLGSKRRYKRLLAAVAGAAVISSTMLPGLPLAKVQAADNPNAAILSTDKAGDMDTVRDKDRDKDRDRDRDRDKDRAGDPVREVRENAARFGFNANTDRFSLISNNGDRAVVRVRSNGQTFNVDLVRDGREWEITTIRGIGDMQHPATYIPASMFHYPTLGIATGPVNQTILMQSTDYNDWQWLESAYPTDMAFGVLLQDPRRDTQTASYVPAAVLARLNPVNFDQKFVLYGHLGSVDPKGYGIAFSQVAQVGNDFIVTVRTKSPAANAALTDTKTDDLVVLDRSTLNFSDPITVTFVDQNGTTLTTYTLTARY